MRILFLLLASTLLSLAGTQSVTVNNGLGTNVPVNQLSFPSALSLYTANPAIGNGISLVNNQGVFEAVFQGDSITQGTGATVPPIVGSIIPYSSAYVSALRQAGFFKNGGQTWNMGLGSQRTAQGLAQYTSDQGQTGSLSCTNGSTAATFTTTPGFVVSGMLVRDLGTPANIPANTTASFTTATTTANTSSGSTTLAVASTTGIVNGMFVICNTADSNAVMTAGTTVTGVSGNNVTISNVMGGGGQVYGNYSFTFVSPSVTLSAAYAGTTATRTLTFAGTLISSTGTFTSGSASVTGVTVTGSSAGLFSGMGMGGASVQPGTTFTISGTTITMSKTATANGSATFFASSPTRDAASGGGYQLYVDNVNSTPHLLSPAVTGLSGTHYYFNNYLLNDAYDIVNSGASYSAWQANYLALLALARADGYKVVVLTGIPPTSSASFGFATVGPQVAIMNTWLKTQSASYDYLIDVAAKFPTGYPAGDIYHFSDGIHPSDLGHALIAGTINDFMFQTIAPSLIQYSGSNDGINDNFLSQNVPLINRSSTFSLPQSVIDTVNIWGTNGNQGPAKLSLYGAPGSNSVGDISDINLGYFTSFPTPINPTGTIVSTYLIQARTSYLQIVDSQNSQNLVKFVPGSGTTGSATFEGSGTFGGSFTAGSSGSPIFTFGSTNYGFIMTLADTFRPTMNIYTNGGGQQWQIGSDSGTLKILAHTGSINGVTSGVGFLGASNVFTGMELYTGNLIMGAIGGGIQLQSGTNARIGSSVEVGGTIVVANTSVVAGDQIYVSNEIPGGTTGCPYISSRTNGTGFTITSTSALDTSTVSWVIIHKN